MEKEYRIKLEGCIIKKEDIYLVFDIFKTLKHKEAVFDFNDQTFVKVFNREEIEKYDFNNKEIKSLKLYFFETNFQTNESSSFRLDSSIFEGCYDITLSSSNDKQYAIFKTNIDEWYGRVLKKRRKVFSSFLSQSFWLSFVLTIPFALFITIGFGALSKWSLESSQTFFIFVVSYFLFYWAVLEIFALFRFCFPKIEIDIGINKHKNGRKAVWLILTVFLVPFLFMIIPLIIGAQK